MAASDLEHVRQSLKEHFGIDVAEIELLDAGSTPNHHVKSASGDQFLVKALRSRLGTWVADNARQVTALAAHAASNGVATAAPVRTPSGALVAVVPGPNQDETTHLIVLEWAIGYQRADHAIAATPALERTVLAELGAVLGKLHRLSLPSDLTLDTPESPGGHCLCDMGTFLEHASDPASLFPGEQSADAKWFRSYLPTLVDFWKGIPEPFSLCHGDPYLDNVLVQGGPSDQLKLLLVDWEDSCRTSPVVDLAACAVGACFTLALGEDSKDVSVSLVHERLVSLIAGYETQRKLTAKERPLLRPSMEACAWACGAFRFGRFLEGVTDVKTRKYGQLIEIVKMLQDMGPKFEELAFADTLIPIDPAPEGAVEMKVSAKKSAAFYVRAARGMLKGLEAKPAEGGREALEAKAPVEALRISGLGDSINAAIAAATAAESEGLCTIVRVQTSYPVLQGSTRSSNCVQIIIDIRRKA